MSNSSTHFPRSVVNDSNLLSDSPAVPCCCVHLFHLVEIHKVCIYARPYVECGKLPTGDMCKAEKLAFVDTEGRPHAEIVPLETTL